MVDMGTIARKSLHGELVVILRDMIVSGELKPGDKVPEAALCVRFGVSRTPLREATKVLAAEGLLQLLPSRGAVVAKITSAEIEELFPIMGVLEGLAGELACKKASDAEIAAIRQMHDEMIGFYRRREYAPYAKLNRAIHEALFAAARSPVLTGYFNNLIIRTHAVRFIARRSIERWSEAVEDHEKMMAALEARNGRLLGELLREHLRQKIAVINEAMAALLVPAAAE